ncbi:MAG: Do family serine endopeptidase [Prosthecobacter sp.]|uniref:Do family serine endopeptidase n=1 Tax=Prosthecobacter sp. TaxID=1965333 RepID=UPI0025CE64F0|nr:Do family serine endopeptidase [Prosthecobacter sp.]MCF7784668.1 Do family serine endopeptidase [Prosthecobacter sp.]
MKTQPRLCIAFTCAGMLASVLPSLQAQQPAALPPGALPPAAPQQPVTPPTLMPPSDLKEPLTANFTAKILRDTNPLTNNGQLQMSYATVVDKILPSVVTIHSSAPIKAPDVDQIPPQLRPFFYRFFGAPGGEDGFGGMNEDDEPPPNPRRRGGQQQPQRPQQPPPEDEAHQSQGVGSGMIITTDGYIITNNHVVADAKKIDVDVDANGSTKTYRAKVIGTDPLTDVALIKIDATGLVPATLGDSSKLRVGDIVLAAGAPMELSRSVSMGIVSALGRSNEGIVGRGNGRGDRVQGYEDFIQTDASINPGNSGGPLVDAMGRVVGISTAILSRTGMNAGIGFAIPINMALHIVEDLLDDGTVQRGFLGVQITDLDGALADRLGFKEHGGAVVMMVGAGSPAEKAGIQLEDIIVAINSQRVDSSSRLRLIVSGTKPGSQIPIDVMRGGKRITMNATLEALPEEALSELSGGGLRGIPRPGAGGQAKDNVSELVSGVTVQTLTPALRERHDIPNEVNGVIVTKVDADSRAAAMGVEENDVISHVNRKPVANAAEARTLAKNSDKTVLLRVWRKGDTMLLMIGNN